MKGKEWELGQDYDVSIIKDSSGKHVIYYRVKRNLAVATTDYLDVRRTGNSPNGELVRVENFSGAMDDD